jgi:hypothetical protein
MTPEFPSAPEDLNGQIRYLLGKFASEKSFRVLGHLSGKAMTAEELAAAAGTGLAELTDELHSLRTGRMIRTWTEGGRELHQLDVTVVRELLRALKVQSVDQVAGSAAGGEGRSIVHRFFEGTKLRNMPSKDKDKQLVLEAILRRLPSQAEMTEKDLNVVLKEIYPDFATLRRELVDHQYLQRDAGVYWLTEKGKAILSQPA